MARLLADFLQLRHGSASPASPINDDERAVASRGDRMGHACRNKVDLALLDSDELAVNLEIHLALEDKQRLVEIVRLIRIGKLVHAQDLEIGACGLSDDGGAPSVWQLRGLKKQIARAHGQVKERSWPVMPFMRRQRWQ